MRKSFLVWEVPSSSSRITKVWTKRKRTHGPGQQCGDCLGEGNVRGLNGNRKNIIPYKILKKESEGAFENFDRSKH